jgi:glycine/D-amino acid oxidase-like deaminating enzyme
MSPYQVIIVGAGILGWSTAIHLQKHGVQRIAVVDRVAPAQATTGAGAGFVGAWAAGFGPQTWGEAEYAIEQYSLDFYRTLGHHHPIQLRENGNLFLARTKHGYDTWIAPMLNHRLTPANTQALDGDATVQISDGAFAREHVYGAVYHPDGMQIHTTPTVHALANIATAGGVTTYYGHEVTGFTWDGGRVSGVRRDNGDTISGDHVVLATGAWSNTLLATVSATLPLYRLVATRVISPTCGIPATLPTIMIPEMGAWIREHQGGLMWGTGDGYAPLSALGSVVPVGERPTHDTLLHSLTNAVSDSFQHLFPAADLTVAEWTQGMPVYTVDRRFCAGAVPNTPGLWAVTGDNEAGVTHAPGLGRLMADLITTQRCSWVDSTAFALDRFTTSYPNEDAVAAAMPPRR